jgi:hypothetical protein
MTFHRETFHPGSSFSRPTPGFPFDKAELAGKQPSLSQPIGSILSSCCNQAITLIERDGVPATLPKLV